MAKNKVIFENGSLFLIKRVKLAHPLYNNEHLLSEEKTHILSGKKKGKKVTNLE